MTGHITSSIDSFRDASGWGIRSNDGSNFTETFISQQQRVNTTKRISAVCDELFDSRTQVARNQTWERGREVTRDRGRPAGQERRSLYAESGPAAAAAEAPVAM
jgi:hypothetical protein